MMKTTMSGDMKITFFTVARVVSRSLMICRRTWVDSMWNREYHLPEAAPSQLGEAGGAQEKKVKTYSTGCVEEFKWHWGYQENWPKSASVVGTNCNKVEFYDEDWNHAGYGDNVWWHQGDAGCINLPWDLQEDLGGLKIWAS